MIDNELILLNVHLTVEIKGEVMQATLLFINNTASRLFLDGMTLCWNNEIERNMFVIVDKDDKKVSYTGLIKNRIVKPEDYVQLDVGEQFNAKVNLNEVYEVIKGGSYTIQYSTYNPSSYDPEDDTLIKMESNKVEVNY